MAVIFRIRRHYEAPRNIATLAVHRIVVVQPGAVSSGAGSVRQSAGWLSAADIGKARAGKEPSAAAEAGQAKFDAQLKAACSSQGEAGTDE
jgi:hypothetical protein